MSLNSHPGNSSVRENPIASCSRRSSPPEPPSDPDIKHQSRAPMAPSSFPRRLCRRDIPRTPGIRQTETLPAVSRHPAAEILGLSVDICPVDIFAQRQHVRIARSVCLRRSTRRKASRPVHHHIEGFSGSSIASPMASSAARRQRADATASEGDRPTAQARVKLGLRPGRSIPLQPFPLAQNPG